jgi:hypothetical protein
MSSVQTVIAQAKKSLTKFTGIVTPSYDDTSLNNISLPIPFYVTNQGVLEIRIQDNVTADILTVGTFSGLSDGPEYQCKVMGGLKPVTSIGDTVKSFLTAYINDIQNGNSPSGEFELVVKPVMTKVQFAANREQIEDTPNEPVQISNYIPSSSEYITGEDVNIYRTVWIFQSPMTVKFYSTDNERFQYATFTSELSED